MILVILLLFKRSSVSLLRDVNALKSLIELLLRSSRVKLTSDVNALTSLMLLTFKYSVVSLVRLSRPDRSLIVLYPQLR